MIAVKSVINKIRKCGLTISFAESCSGGNIAAEVIKISGVSDIFMGGVVTYSDEAKIDILNVLTFPLWYHIIDIITTSNTSRIDFYKLHFWKLLY